MAQPVNRGHAQGRPVVRQQRRENGNFACANGFSVQQLINPVPEFGFDFHDLQVINSNLAEKAAIDPVTQIRLNEARKLGCGNLGTEGYVLLGGGGYAMPEEVAQESEGDSGNESRPQVIVVQVPAQAQPTQTAARLSPAPQEVLPPLPDEVQFVLVTRDGAQVQAAAFTRTPDQIIYITPEGLRRTISRSDLDTDATIRVNSERGTQVQLSL
jgi:hypothetical protein